MNQILEVEESKNSENRKIYLVDYVGIEYENVWRSKKGKFFNFYVFFYFHE